MTNIDNHDPLTIPLAEMPAAPIEVMSHEEALLRPRPFTFRDLTGCVTTLGGGSNSLHEPAGSPATHSYAQTAPAGRSA